MSFDSTRAAIETRMASRWGSEVPVLYEADGIAPPVGQAFVRISIREYGGNQVTLGIEPVMRWHGAIVCDAFSPLASGTAEARRLGDRFRKIFERATFDTIRCKHVTPDERGEVDGWWQSQYRCYYYRDEQSRLEG